MRHRVFDRQIPDDERRETKAKGGGGRQAAREVRAQQTVNEHESREAVEQRCEADRPLVRVVVAVGPEVRAKLIHRDEPGMGGPVERTPEERRPDRILTRAVPAERRLVVREVDVAIHDERPDLDEIRTAVGRGTLELQVENEQQAEQKGDEDEADAVQPGRLAHEPGPRVGWSRARDPAREQNEHEDAGKECPEQGGSLTKAPQQRDVPDGSAGEREQQDRDAPHASDDTGRGYSR
jgi:hypothetical protein